ncbi:potassium channel subfamily K member 4 [Engraulis encrasicolus]|uniref:potassium channel subfamily K member 4 n=1 Tax=Engraulis encrasicolus TaxID=184585 RepID=UPI002FD61A1C
MRCSTLLTIFTFVLLYLVLGAVVFRALEVPHETDHYLALLKAREEYLGNYTCMSPEALQGLIERVADALGNGADPTVNATFTTSWDLASALFFSGTIITTIGYGNISPKTDGGKLFCIFYALVGIPMFGILLAGVGDHLGTGLRNAVAKVEMFLMKWKVSPTIVRVITAVLSIALGVALFVALPIIVFQEVEHWTLLDSAYFVVITLTTVGFGDYVAGEQGVAGSDHWYKPLVWFWILVGLAYFASILAMIGNWLRVLSKKTRAEMEGLRAHATDWTTNIQNMSVDFRMPNMPTMEDPFKRVTTRRRRRHRSHGHGGDSGGAGEGGDGRRHRGGHDGQHPGSESGSSFYSYSSNESGSESCSADTQTERMHEGETERERSRKLKPPPPIPATVPSAPPAPDPDPATTTPSPGDQGKEEGQPLAEYFGENLAYIDESSDAVSGKVRLDPQGDSSQTSSARRAKRRRPKRPAPQYRATHRTSPGPGPTENGEPIGDVPPPPTSTASRKPPPGPPKP